jgi:hypothetical protein
LYLPSTILYNAWHSKTTQHSKLINAECHPIHEKTKTKLITYTQQEKEKANNTKMQTPSKLHDDQLSIVFTLSTSPNPRRSSYTRLFHHPDTHLAFVHTEKHTQFFCHRQTSAKLHAKKFLEEYCFVDFIHDSKLAHFQMLVNHLD